MKRLILIPLLLTVWAGLRAQTEAAIHRARQDPQTARLAAEADVRLINLRRVTDSAHTVPSPTAINQSGNPLGNVIKLVSAGICGFPSARSAGNIYRR